MIPVKVMPKFRCDFCKKRSIKSVMELHEKRCFRNPNRYCDYCDNKGFTLETIEIGFEAKVDCPFCSRFNPEQLKEIEAREKSLESEPIPPFDPEDIPF